jgi:hypothetical protein
MNRIHEILQHASPSLQGGINDPDALEVWIRKMNEKVETGATELKRMGEKMTREFSGVAAAVE